MSPRSIARGIGRAIVVATVLAFLAIVGIQFGRIIERNVALANTLWGVDRDIATLKTERERRLARIKRLEDPQGAIPEIHDRLRLMLPGESIIYLKGTPAPAPSP